MFADVWTKRDFVAAGFMLVGLLLVVSGQAFDWRLVSIAGFVVGLAGAARAGGLAGRRRPGRQTQEARRDLAAGRPCRPHLSVTRGVADTRRAPAL